MAKSKRRKTARRYKPKTAPAKVVPERLKQYASALDIPRVRRNPRLLSLLFCDFANRTDDEKVNLLGIFDRIFVHPEIKTSPGFVLYGRTAETFEDNLWLRIFDPDNEPAAEVRFDPPRKNLNRDETELDSPNQMQFSIPLQMTFHKQGTYWFDIAYRDYSLGGAGLVVRFRNMGEKQNATDTFV